MNDNPIIQLMCKSNTYNENRADLIVNKIYLCKLAAPGYDSSMKYYKVFGERLDYVEYGDCYFYTEEQTKQNLRDTNISKIII